MSITYESPEPWGLRRPKQTPRNGIQKTPVPSGTARAAESRRRRHEAAELANKRPAKTSFANGEEATFADTVAMNFTKGLPHDALGVVDYSAYREFVEAINGPAGDAKQHEAFRVPHGPRPDLDYFCQYRIGDAPHWKNPVWRPWESPRSGHYYDLQGPDADAVGLAPAPVLGKSELCAEMAELYAMALLRDVPFEKISDGTGSVEGGASVAEILDALNTLSWFDPDQKPFTSFPKETGEPRALTEQEKRRRDARRSDPDRPLTYIDLFRGSLPGVKSGPYISQFLLMGNPGRAGARVGNGSMWQPAPYTRHKEEDGLIVYGDQIIDQRVCPHQEGIDYMSEWAAWLDVQNGADVKDADLYRDERRFITTPRDLATFVHFDALHQAYLNASVLLLRKLEGKPFIFDVGFPTGDVSETRGHCASFGPPHLLALVTEAATRSLKAVRRQKFNIHRRARPERVGAVLSLVANGYDDALGAKAAGFSRVMLAELETSGLMQLVDRHNGIQNGLPEDCRNVRCRRDHPDFPELSRNYLVPMAYPEGSPMHPSYGSGHAAVAGACVTILKAFFEMAMIGSAEVAALTRFRDGGAEPNFFADRWWEPRTLADIGYQYAWQPATNNGSRGKTLNSVEPGGMTVEGELNKLAANVALGRSMAGVHFYSDYYESVRMGERIAVAILQEQMLAYNEPVIMRLPSFDEDRIVISTWGTGDRTDARVEVRTKSGEVDDEGWWTRHLPSKAAR
jgi:hypothetical protein